MAEIQPSDLIVLDFDTGFAAGAEESIASFSAWLKHPQYLDTTGLPIPYQQGCLFKCFLNSDVPKTWEGYLEYCIREQVDPRYILKKDEFASKLAINH